MPNNIKIRNITKPHLKQAAHIFYKAFTSVGEKWTEEMTYKRLEDKFDPKTQWVAIKDNKVAGVLIAKIDYVLSKEELYIDIIAVDPKLHKQGIGKLLWKTAVNYTKANDLGGMWLATNKRMPAHNWYIKNGMKETSWINMYIGADDL